MGNQQTKPISTPETETPTTYHSGWFLRANHKTHHIRNTPFVKNEKIYFVTDGDEGEEGIVCYNPIKDTFDPLYVGINEIFSNQNRRRLIKYHSYVNIADFIYILTGTRKPAIIVYNINKNKLYHDFDYSQNVGWDSTSVAVKDYIHIFGGLDNTKHKMVHTQTQKNNGLVSVIGVNRHEYDFGIRIQNPCVIYHDVLKRIFMFAIYDYTNGNRSNKFYCSDVLVDEEFVENVENVLLSSGFSVDVSKIILLFTYDIYCNDWTCLEIKWNVNKHATLPICVNLCGYLLLDNKYIVLFGGKTRSDCCLDSIYFLNVYDMQIGWKLLPKLKCPLESTFHAVLLSNKQEIHLFTRRYKPNPPKHFAISVALILKHITDIEAIND